MAVPLWSTPMAASSRIPISAWCCAIPTCRGSRRCRRPRAALPARPNRCRKPTISHGHRVLTAYGAGQSARLDHVSSRLPVEEAYAPLYASHRAHRLDAARRARCSPLSPACCWRGAWWCRSRRCAPAPRASARAISASASTIKTGDELEGARRSVQRHGGRACRNPMPTWKRRSKTALSELTKSLEQQTAISRDPARDFELAERCEAGARYGSPECRAHL